MIEQNVGERQRARTRAALVWLRLARVSHRLQQDGAGHLRRWELTPAQFDVLANVGASPGLSQQALADSLLVTKGDVCQLLDRMSRGGLIARRQEGRANRVFLTDTGERRYAEVLPAHEARIASRLAVLSPEELARLRDSLRKLDRALR